MRLEYQILVALLLDLLVGDPRWLPHPVRLIGRLAAATETRCRGIFDNQRLAGLVTVFVVLVVTGLSGSVIVYGAARLNPLFGSACSVLLLYFCLAGKDLAVHSMAVWKALSAEDIPDARKKVAMIVGRDTNRLNKEQIVRAGIESVAENIVDGVTAPLFYAVLGGPIGALLYKAVNTMDSTFGYKNGRYLQFGRTAARLDDLANFLPARISGLVVVAATFILRMRMDEAWRILRRDRLQHASPNSGHTEAAVAGALGLQLGGLSYYFGKPVLKPTIGDDLTTPDAAHIGMSNRLLLVTTALMALLLLGGRMILDECFR